MMHWAPPVAEVAEHPVYGWPVSTLEELDQLDPDEMYAGYRDGRDGEPEPGGNRSRAFWHGWRNGAVDGGHRAKDEAQAALAAIVHREMLGSRRKHGEASAS